MNPILGLLLAMIMLPLGAHLPSYKVKYHHSNKLEISQTDETLNNDEFTFIKNLGTDFISDQWPVQDLIILSNNLFLNIESTPSIIVRPLSFNFSAIPPPALS